jgi:hypothetical protein
MLKTPFLAFLKAGKPTLSILPHLPSTIFKTAPVRAFSRSDFWHLSFFSMSKTMDMAIVTKTTLKCLGPYHVENTSSRPITEVKQH